LLLDLLEPAGGVDAAEGLHDGVGPAEEGEAGVVGVEELAVAGRVAVAPGVGEAGEEGLGAADDAEPLEVGVEHPDTMTVAAPPRQCANPVPNAIGWNPGLSYPRPLA